jgi:hypothetical protein
MGYRVALTLISAAQQAGGADLISFESRQPDVTVVTAVSPLYRHIAQAVKF